LLETGVFALHFVTRNPREVNIAVRISQNRVRKGNLKIVVTTRFVNLQG
jgi:hypothetical protein